jgi:hypothetical protein
VGGKEAMRFLRVRSVNKSSDCRAAFYQSTNPKNINIKAVQGRICWCGLILVFLTLFTGCIPVPLPSKLTDQDKLQQVSPLEQDDVIVVYGDNAANPWASPSSNSLKSLTRYYFTAGCTAVFHNDTVGELITAILKVNPQPGRFAVKHLNEVGDEESENYTATGGDSILSQMHLSKTTVLKEHLRYAIYVKEKFEAKAHLPLYAPPFGIASCGNKTDLEASIWELPTEKFIGSFIVSAEGEYTVAAYMLHVVAFRDTQKDATEKLAKDIVERLTGLKALKNKVD